MTQQRTAKEHRCMRCDKTYISMMRLGHHRAAEHAPRTLKDIRTVKDVRTMPNLWRR
jgi:primosomal protein N'